MVLDRTLLHRVDETDRQTVSRMDGADMDGPLFPDSLDLQDMKRPPSTADPEGDEDQSGDEDLSALHEGRAPFWAPGRLQRHLEGWST